MGLSDTWEYLPCLSAVLCACRGELVSNCRSLDGSSQLQCFVQGLDVVQDCADTRNYPTELAPAMLAAGRGTDGQEGSLCTAVLVGADAAGNKRALYSAACCLLRP